MVKCRITNKVTQAWAQAEPACTRSQPSFRQSGDWSPRSSKYLIMVMLLPMVLLLVLGSATDASYIRSPASGDLPMEHVSLKKGSVDQIIVTFATAGYVTINYATARSVSASVNLFEDEAVVMRKGCTSDPKAVASAVHYGTKPSELIHSSNGSVICYSTEHYDSPVLHSVVVGPLLPNTKYFYRCGASMSLQSDEFFFQTPPLSHGDSGEAIPPFRLAFVGDLGQTSDSLFTTQHIKESGAGVLINVGDLSYADGDQPRWDSWARMLQPLSSGVIMAVTAGNHEIEPYILVKNSLTTPLNGTFLAYETRLFDLDNPRSGSPSALYHSHDVAGVHVVMLASYAPFEAGSPQYTWLEADLKAVDRQKTPWVIVGMHAPWYNSNFAHEDEAEPMMFAMEDLFYDYAVDLVYAGHVHAYERSLKAYRQRPDRCGTVFITIGDGGNREGLAEDYFNPSPVWSVFREASFGHGTLDVLNSTHAFWRWVRNQDGEAVAADQVMMVKDAFCEKKNLLSHLLRQRAVASAGTI